MTPPNLQPVILAMLLVVSGCHGQTPTKAKVKPPSSAECNWNSPHDHGGQSGIYVCKDGKFVFDQQATDEQNRLLAEIYHHRAELIWAMRTRILTAAEMSEVQGYGSSLLTHEGQAYYQADVDREFNQLLLNQFQMRLVAEKVAKGDCGCPNAK